MNNKNIIKGYEQICALLKNDKSEEVKQKYIIIFKELDLQLNNQLTKIIEDLSYTGKTLKDEIKRVESIIAALKYRRNFREKMAEEYLKLIGYKPIELLEIKELEFENDYIAYKQNLSEGLSIITELMKTGKKVNELKQQASKKSKNKTQLLKEADKLQQDRSAKIELLKQNEEVVNDLYDYCITAPFNEENAYIQYILIKINPKSTLKIKLGNTPNRAVKKQEAKETEKKVQEEMPIIPSLGSVRPNNMLKYMEEATENFDDINLPTNGLLENTKKVQIDSKKIEEN